MNAEIVMASLLSAAGITALVGTRRALGQLPQNTTFPALVYNLISNTPTPNVAYQVGPQRARARFQINPLALTVPEVKSIHAAIRTALDFKHQQIIAGKKVVSCRVSSVGLLERDNDAGVWTQPADYILEYYE
jgi:hypothetical protein